jgi:5'-nucleotidase
MPTILLTNDDGIESPTLVPLARALGALGDVRVVVPSTERSWIGKAITRFDVVEAHATARDGIDMYAVTGSPADCVSLGVHTLYPDRPDLVVSGINLGLNFGLAFVLSSGTIGGVLEGWIAGVPGIAFSMAIPNDAYGLKGAQRIAALGNRPVSAAREAAEITGTIWRNGFPAGVDCFSVNFPDDVGPTTARVVGPVTRSRYGPLFVPGPEKGYIHQFQSLTPLEAPADGDMQVVGRGAVAITPLRLDLGTGVPEDLRSALERTS